MIYYQFKRKYLYKIYAASCILASYSKPLKKSIYLCNIKSHVIHDVMSEMSKDLNDVIESIYMCMRGRRMRVQ